MSRIATRAGRLARAGFANPTAVAAVLESWNSVLGPDADRLDTLVAELAESPDPDIALGAFDRLAQDAPDAFGRLVRDPVLATRAARVLGTSIAFAQHVAAHAGDLDVLAGDVSARDAAALRELGVAAAA